MYVNVSKRGGVCSPAPQVRQTLINEGLRGLLIQQEPWDQQGFCGFTVPMMRQAYVSLCASVSRGVSETGMQIGFLNWSSTQEGISS